jgi:hypothetical protein
MVVAADISSKQREHEVLRSLRFNQLDERRVEKPKQKQPS